MELTTRTESYIVSETENGWLVRIDDRNMERQIPYEQHVFTDPYDLVRFLADRHGIEFDTDTLRSFTTV